MQDVTTIQANSEPNQDSVVFGCLSPIVFKTVLDTTAVIGAVLNWSPLARSFLSEVLRQLPDDGNVLALKHSEFAAILWPGCSLIAGRRRVGRAVQALKNDQQLSGFLAVWVESGNAIEVDGHKEYQPTTYRLRDFYSVFDRIQRRVAKDNVLALPQQKRRAQLRGIVQKICIDLKYQAVPSRARQQQKSAAVSEAAGAASSLGERVTKQDVHGRMEAALEELFQVGIDWANLGLNTKDYWTKVLAGLEVNELRLADAIARSNAPRGLKLVGGRPK